jgi:RimJ/RimL family protein N-acetyltransferase
MNVKRVCGHRLCLRVVTPEDAVFIHRLRTNPTYNTHLSTVTGTDDDQRAWIERYKAREAAGSELYYVIERRDETPCGVVRLYDVGPDSFTWGSWILNKDKPAKAALESAVLSFGVGFEQLGLARAIFDVRLDNSRAIAFYRRFGATETGRDDVNIYFEYARDRYIQDRDTHFGIIKEHTDA